MTAKRHDMTIPGRPKERTGGYRICIATTQIFGPTTCGDAGMAMTALAQTLAEEADVSVTVVLAASVADREVLERWESCYRRQGIDLVDLSAVLEENTVAFGGDNQISNPVIAAYHLYRYLKTEYFDVIQLPDSPGLGFYALIAKEFGLAFGDTVFAITVFGPTLWDVKADHTPIKSTLPLMQDVMERKSIQLADVRLSPTDDMIEWLSRRRWISKRKHSIRKMPSLFPRGLFIDRGDKNGSLPDSPRPENLVELVYWGELGHRKGMVLFFDAIERLADENRFPFLVTFLARFSNDAASKRTFGMRAVRWGFAWRVIDKFDCFQAVDFLKACDRRIAVFPSMVDNSPWEVQACLEYEIPFVAARLPGICEFLSEDCLDDVTFEPTVAELTGKLAAVTDGRFPTAISASGAVEQSQTVKALYANMAVGKPLAGGEKNRVSIKKRAADTLQRWTNPVVRFFRSGGNCRKPNDPLVSVCVLHRDRPHFLKYALASVAKQTYPNVEVLLFDNGSVQPDSRSYLEFLKTQARIRVIESGTNLFPAAARNRCVQQARGEFIKFLDDDNQMRPNELEVFVNAFRKTDYDVLTCFLDCYRGTPPVSDEDIFTRWLFLGDARSMNWLFNCMGDTNFAIRKDQFQKIGGFEEEGILYPAEDWRFLNKAVSRGLKLGVVPEALVYYRLDLEQDQNNWRKMNIFGGLYRTAAYALARCPDEKMHDAVHLLQGLFRG